MSIRHKTNARIGLKCFKVVGALMVMAMTVATAQETNAPSEPAESTDSAPPAAKAPPAANSPAQVTAEPIADGRTAIELLRAARLQLRDYRTLKAKVVELIEFGPRRFKAEGVYLQGRDNRLRLDLAVRLENISGRLLQVSEGDILWTVYEIGGAPRVTRRDVKQILAAAERLNASTMIAQDLGLGGLPALLGAIEQSMDFSAPTVATIEGRKFHVLQGEWKQAIRDQFQQQAQAQPVPSDKPRPLPEHVPDLVRIYLDAETSFPYRIRYLRRASNAGAEPRPVLTIDFQDIVVNAAIDPVEFRYSAPDGANVVDLTNLYLQQLRGGEATPPGGSPASGGPGAVPGTVAPGAGGTP